MVDDSNEDFTLTNHRLYDPKFDTDIRGVRHLESSVDQFDGPKTQTRHLFVYPTALWLGNCEGFDVAKHYLSNKEFTQSRLVSSTAYRPPLSLVL